MRRPSGGGAGAYAGRTGSAGECGAVCEPLLAVLEALLAVAQEKSWGSGRETVS
jgi:hypothetical protein